MDKSEVAKETQKKTEVCEEYYTEKTPFYPYNASPNPFIKKLKLRLENYNSELFSDDFKLDK